MEKTFEKSNDTYIGESFVMPEDVIRIADGAFAENKKLKHIDLRNVRYIGARAFQECSNLESVIMRNVTEIGPKAFEFCRSLSNVTFGEVIRIGDSAFSFCGMLDIPEIPRSLTHAGAAAFSHTAVQRVDLHWLEEIPSYLFSGCTSLGFADIRGAKAIGDDAFSGCTSLSFVIFGDVRKIGAKAFCRCDSFELTNLPQTLEEMGDDAFSNVRTGLVIPKSVRMIGKNCLGPVDRKKKIGLYKSTLYEFRNYFREGPMDTVEEDHYYLWESSIDVTVLDDETDQVTGLLPLYSDLDSVMRAALISAFKPDNTFDYSVLDTVIFTEMRWNQRAKDRLVAMRYKYPYELSGENMSSYAEYLSKHAKRIAMRAVRDKDIEMLSFLYDCDLIGEEFIIELIDYSLSLSASECTALLLERQAELGCRNDPLFDEL